ncbi:LytR/AlgR family response regulator transcription factor [Pedobacter sp. UC225_65]|uniref:LytR/AlgR family response regulator transcription factor n=1 Tax=Pedobacter sp. UC225_65 TaxID=3350173 RepID=UPI003672621E
MVKIKQQIFNSENLKTQLLLVVAFIIVFTIFQDFLHSNFNNYNFYFSESLLFKSFWFLFLPLLLIQSKSLKTYLHPKCNKAVVVLLSVVLPSILHLLLFPIVVWILSALFFDHTYSILATLNYTLSEDLYKYILIYGSAALIFSYRKTPYPSSNLPIPFLQKITVNMGRNYITIPVEDILFIAASAPYIAIHTAENSHLHTETLKSMSDKLDPQQFIRVHKSTVININKVVSYKSRLNGDYDLLLSTGETVRLSRNYAQSYKQLLHSTQ